MPSEIVFVRPQPASETVADPVEPEEEEFLLVVAWVGTGMVPGALIAKAPVTDQRLMVVAVAEVVVVPVVDMPRPPVVAIPFVLAPPAHRRSGQHNKPRCLQTT